MVSKASTSSFSSYSAGARDDDFDCLGDSGSSMMSLGSILKRLHVRLMKSAKIFIFTFREVCAFTPAKREEKSAFCSNFWVVGVRWAQIYSRGHTIFFCLFFVRVRVDKLECWTAESVHSNTVCSIFLQS